MDVTIQILCLLLALPAVTVAREGIDSLVVRKAGPTAESFVPPGYLIIDKKEADFNDDGLTDVVMVIEQTVQDNAKALNDHSRPLIVLLQQGDQTYRISALAQNVVPCSACGGGHRGDAFSGLEVKKNTFFVLSESGSNLRSDMKQQFRLHGNEWYLIGETSSSYYGMATRGVNVADPPFDLKDSEYCSYVLNDHNFLTGEVETTWGIQNNTEEVESAGPYYSWQRTIREKSARHLVRMVEVRSLGHEDSSWTGVAYTGGCESLTSTLEIQGCLATEYARADTELNKVYKELRDSLPADAKEMLKAAQIAWIAYRDKDCEFQSSDPGGGDGLAYRMGHIVCLTKKTVHRTKELKDYEG